MELIKPNDPQYFEQSSCANYNRHQYKIVDKTGDSVIVEDYIMTQEIWWNKGTLLSHIEILDKKEKPITKGFK